MLSKLQPCAVLWSHTMFTKRAVRFVPTTPPCITPHTPSRLSTKYCLLVFTRQGSTLTAAAVHCPDPQHTLQHANCQHIVQVYRTHSHQGACRQKHWPNRTHPYPTQRSVVAAMQVCCRQLLYTVNNSMEPLTLCPTTNLGSRQLTLCPCTKPVHRRQHEPATAARTASSLDDERVDAPPASHDSSKHAAHHSCTTLCPSTVPCVVCGTPR